jgi:hypothetical protein
VGNTGKKQSAMLLMLPVCLIAKTNEQKEWKTLHIYDGIHRFPLILYKYIAFYYCTFVFINGKIKIPCSSAVPKIEED